ncbi:hemerythrin domain-containing protein [Propioniciclava coleopterorum]|uniref:Hemerythrin domain-containing protein n=1 Tax=Propioniciclava coleopterorum TaxID=2714937 RepID=A0A6G7Y9F3_9ACTN|nr:hemerythrin domain-containing protein [Propioniciclava coleopterorum]QIK73524.1 hemerythrin domain-containing protein [Propioniciclava coleopterorum]
MAERDRLVAWNRELLDAHDRLRRALRLARDSDDPRDAAAARSDLRLHCLGFCAALGGHHAAEDAALFPELVARRPDLAPTIERLVQDHAMVAGLLADLDAALASDAAPAALRGHLDGLAAIMESHFRYEERELLGILATLDLDADPRAVLGPL